MAAAEAAAEAMVATGSRACASRVHSGGHHGRARTFFFSFAGRSGRPLPPVGGLGCPLPLSLLADWAGEAGEAASAECDSSKTGTAPLSAPSSSPSSSSSMASTAAAGAALRCWRMRLRSRSRFFWSSYSAPAGVGALCRVLDRRIDSPAPSAAACRAGVAGGASSASSASLSAASASATSRIKSRKPGLSGAAPRRGLEAADLAGGGALAAPLRAGGIAGSVAECLRQIGRGGLVAGGSLPEVLPEVGSAS